jgi:hypothetical protein
MIEMVNNLARLIIKQFIDIVHKISEKCCISWNKCAIKIVSRQYIDTLVIEIYDNKAICHDPLASYIPIPLVVIDFTNIKKECLDNEKWKKYLEKRASDLLNKIAEQHHNILHKHCCPSKKLKHGHANKCNCVYREEFYLCHTEKLCKDKPYDDWGKLCKKDKIKCHTQPKCPIKIDYQKKSKCPKKSDPIKITIEKNHKDKLDLDTDSDLESKSNKCKRHNQKSEFVAKGDVIHIDLIVGKNKNHKSNSKSSTQNDKLYDSNNSNDSNDSNDSIDSIDSNGLDNSNDSSDSGDSFNEKIE